MEDVVRLADPIARTGQWGFAFVLREMDAPLSRCVGR